MTQAVSSSSPDTVENTVVVKLKWLSHLTMTMFSVVSVDDNKKVVSTKGTDSAQKALRWRGPARRKDQGN